MSDTMQPDMEQTDQLTDGLADQGGTIDESRAWLNDLPDDLKEAKTFNKFTVGDDTKMVSVPDSLLKSHLSLESMLSDRNKVPEDEEGLKELRTKLGWEPDFDKYSEGIKRAEMPEGVEYDSSEEEFLLQKAHERGIPLKDAQAIYDDIVKSRLSAIQDGASASEGYLAKVEEDFKAKYQGDLDVMKNRAKVAMKDMGDDNLINLLETAEVDGRKLGDHPALFEFMAKLGKEKLGLGDERGQTTSTEDAGSIQEQIDEAMANPAYWDETHIQHKGTVAKVNKLFQRLHGEIQAFERANNL